MELKILIMTTLVLVIVFWWMIAKKMKRVKRMREMTGPFSKQNEIDLLDKEEAQLLFFAKSYAVLLGLSLAFILYQLIQELLLYLIALGGLSFVLAGIKVIQAKFEKIEWTFLKNDTIRKSIPYLIYSFAILSFLLVLADKEFHDMIINYIKTSNHGSN
jgi:hypothetical protein